ncbi:FAD-binding and (Fe-S)-binding domain-containing protein [Streptomyces odontomachi]|uniref:FAD-binding and (Fe-S)-binding domain-containing protein n=1 Tax=Streptomyces odontomachi TaxID=2944940 RepID=UPI00210BB21F|nr:FAD-binding and (Fe-S)-binding domain-containing protein [Streptomyces sp. ODS25]
MTELDGVAQDTRADGAAALHKDLLAAVRGGAADVDFSATARALNTMDASNYRRVPLGTVAPRDADDVAAALAVCRDHGVPVVARGGGTSIAGQATGTGVVLDFTRHMNRIVALDPEARTAVVQPGLVLDRLQEAAAPHGLRFGPDPSTHGRCTLGGMIGNNSCGSHSVAWGTTADSVRELSVVGYGGERRRAGKDLEGAPEGLRELVEGDLALLRTGFPELPRRISGYALDALLPEHGGDVARFLCGTEGTLAVLTEAVVDLVEMPRARVLAVLGYPDEGAAADAAAGLLPHRPLTVEGMAADLVPVGTAGLPKGGAWLFVEVGGDTGDEARARAEALVRAADVVDSVVVSDPAGQRMLWRVREDASGTATRMPDDSEAWPGWEDCAVPPARLGAYLRDFRTLLRAHDLRGTPYGHFGDGCIHVRIDFDLIGADGVRRFRRFSEELAELVVAHGGSLSGEHGDGLARAELLPKMYGTELVRLFERAKALWDPSDGLNPGVLVRPAPLDENLRFTPLPADRVDVAFGYPHDGGDFSAAVRRCVGVAKCRTTAVAPGDTAVMCPSYRATGEERHSTRGRARLLHEMLAGGVEGAPGPAAGTAGAGAGGSGGPVDVVITDGWRSTEVLDALDLCLSCKGCRSDCPVGVDMATYKAEFLHHHYQGRRRPAAHYALGRLPRWLRAVSRLRLAGAANAAARVGPLAAVAKRLGGIAPEREIPPLPRETFRQWFARRPDVSGVAGPHGARVTEGSGAGEAAGQDGTGDAAADASVTGASVTGAPVTGASVGGDVTVLWPDTFTNHLSPDVAKAAVRVFEDAGRRIAVPPDGVCCGLTYVSTGQLDQARAVLRRTLDLLEPAGFEGPMVVLEPSCAGALKTDLPELLPDDPRARRLADSVRTFAQALEEQAPEWVPPRLDRAAVGQTHCHQHAVLGDAAERRLRDRAGLTGTLSGGCCGLAGNFGFERGHYDVSVACAEEQLLPAVRQAPPGAAVLADGYSCRTQLRQLAGTRGRHLAELLAEALDGREAGEQEPEGRGDDRP